MKSLAKWLVAALCAGPLPGIACAPSAATSPRVSPFNSHNVPSRHERFATYVRDIEAAQGAR